MNITLREVDENNFDEVISLQYETGELHDDEALLILEYCKEEKC